MILSGVYQHQNHIISRDFDRDIIQIWKKGSAIPSTFETVFQTVVPPKLNTVLNTVLVNQKNVFNTVLLTKTCKINPLP